MPNWSLGRTGQVYVKAESTYGTAPTLAATSAVRHLNINLHFDPKGLRKSPERHTDPSQRFNYVGRTTASWDLKAQLYPSTILNTVPEADALLAAAFGQAATNTTLSTTFSGGTETTTTGTVVSAAGLAIGQAIQIVIASGGSAGTYIRFLTNVSGANLTWGPALPAAPADADTCKGCVTYNMANAYAPTSLDIAHYPQSPSQWFNREMLGCVVNKLALMIDSSVEPLIQLSGPAQGLVVAGAQSQPGGFTTVGAENAIPSGLTGYFNYGATLYQIEKLQFEIDNGHDLQNTALGTAKAAAAFRKGKRAVTVKVDAKVSDDLTLWTPSLTGNTSTLFLQLGTTATKIIGLFLPLVQVMKTPDTPDADETNNWGFELAGLGTSGNDDARLAFC